MRPLSSALRPIVGHMNGEAVGLLVSSVSLQRAGPRLSGWFSRRSACSCPAPFGTELGPLPPAVSLLWASLVGQWVMEWPSPLSLLPSAEVSPSVKGSEQGRGLTACGCCLPAAGCAVSVLGVG